MRKIQSSWMAVMATGQNTRDAILRTRPEIAKDKYQAEAVAKRRKTVKKRLPRIKAR